MPRRTLDSRFGLVLISSLVACVAQVAGCASNDGGLEPGGKGGKTANGGSTSSGGTSQTGGTGPGDGGTSAEGGAGHIEGGATSTEGGAKSSDGGATTGGTSGSGATGGLGFGGAVGSGGTIAAGGVGGADAGSGGTDTGGKSCVYFSEGGEVIDQGGAGGAGPTPTITVLKNAFAGNYLADAAGKALYTYGADAPGDCNYEPITNCFLDCAISWPPFNGEPRLLADGLDDSLFGTIQRSDGTPAVVTSQTTYKGWPLYYYKNDLAPKDVKGEAVGRIWALATVILPNITVIRMGTVRFVADEGGRTLYTSEADTKGTMTASPVSACTGSCLDAFEPFVLTYLSPVTYLAPSDFTYFVRSDGKPQIAYKGAPLYLSHADLRTGQTNGTATTGWLVATP